MELKAEECH